jgi:hypothetical protein
MLECENTLLHIMDWNLMVLTPLHCLYSLLGMGIIFPTDKISTKEANSSKGDSSSVNSSRASPSHFQTNPSTKKQAM